MLCSSSRSACGKQLRVPLARVYPVRTCPLRNNDTFQLRKKQADKPKELSAPECFEMFRSTERPAHTMARGRRVTCRWQHRSSRNSEESLSSCPKSIPSGTTGAARDPVGDRRRSRKPEIHGAFLHDPCLRSLEKLQSMERVFLRNF